MNKRVWIGILTGVVAAVVVLGVAGAAFKGGDDDHDEVTRTVPVGGTGEVRVVGDDDGDEEHKAGLFLLPLLLIPLVILGVVAARGGFGNGGPHGRDASFEEQHRRAHEHANAVRPGPAPQPAPEPGPEPEAKM